MCGNGAAGIERQWCQHWKHGSLKVSVESDAGLFIQLPIIGDTNAGAGKSGFEMVAQTGIGSLFKLGYFAMKRLQQFRAGETVDSWILGAGGYALLKHGDPHLEELVDIRAENRQEHDSFQKRVGRILSLQ